MLKNCVLFFGCFSLVIALIFFILISITQKVYLKTYKLSEQSLLDCQETTISDIIQQNGVISGNCYTFIADFDILEEACSDNILKDSICGKCIELQQTVLQYQKMPGNDCRRRHQGNYLTHVKRNENGHESQEYQFGDY